MDILEAKLQHLVSRLDAALVTFANLDMTRRLKSNIRGLQRARVGCDMETVILFAMENVVLLITNPYYNALVGRPISTNKLQLVILLLKTW